MSQPYPPGPQDPWQPGPQGPWQPPTDHPQATTILVLGILGLVLCGLIAPFAWSMGSRALQEVDAAQGRIGGRGMVQAGRIMGIIGTVILVGGLLLVLAIFLFAGLGLVASNS